VVVTPSLGAAAPDAAWTFSPLVLGGVALALIAYVTRWRRTHSARERHPPSLARLAVFLAGLAAVLVALVSPVDRLAEQLFTMHMVQHLLLLDVAPILVLLGFTRVLLRPVTRRLQTVERRVNPRYYRLIEEFEKLTGVPVLLNTSFNENEPIVMTPEHAVDTFQKTHMDVLALGNHVVRRA